MNGIGVQRHVVDVESNSPHVLFAKHTFFRRPLKTSNDGILDFIQILYSFRNIREQVRASGVWTEAPDFSGLVNTEFEFLSHEASTGFHLLTRRNVTLNTRVELNSGFHEKIQLLIELTSSMAWAMSSGKGLALIKSLLCLLGDFDRHILSDSSLTVSRYDTTGSDFWKVK